MKPLTTGQQKVYDCILEGSENGRIPSVRELCDATGFRSTSTVAYHLTPLLTAGGGKLSKRLGSLSTQVLRREMRPEALVGRLARLAGLIEREEGLNRCIRLKNEQPTSKVPLMGRVTAGQPILAVQDIETYIPVPKDISKGRELFALRVVGESMINAGIFDGDIIIVHHTPSADNGDIVVAMVEDELSGESSATVKRFYKEKGHIRLQPENDAFEPIIVDKAVLLGKVVTLIRNYE